MVHLVVCGRQVGKFEYRDLLQNFEKVFQKLNFIFIENGRCISERPICVGKFNFYISRMSINFQFPLVIRFVHF